MNIPDHLFPVWYTPHGNVNYVCVWGGGGVCVCVCVFVCVWMCMCVGGGGRVRQCMRVYKS